MKSAAELKKRANEIATTVVTVLSGIVITGATFGTGGLAFAPQVGIALGKALAAGLLKGALKKALEGDKFNVVDTVSSITLDLMVTSVMAAGIAAPTGPNALAEASAGFKGKKDAASIFQNAAMKFAINTAVREAISTATTRAMDADPKKLGLDQEALIRLRGWVEDFALNMATIEANQHTAHDTQAGKDTTKLIAGAVKPVTGELLRPMDDKMKAERRKLGKPTVAEAEVTTSSGVTKSQLGAGQKKLQPGTNELLVRARAAANDLARHLATYGAQVPAEVRTRAQAAIQDCRQETDRVRTQLAMGNTPDITALAAARDRAEDADADIMTTVLTAINVPTHEPPAPLPEFPSVPTHEPGALPEFPAVPTHDPGAAMTVFPSVPTHEPGALPAFPAVPTHDPSARQAAPPLLA
jgi:hypothetical protein